MLAGFPAVARRRNVTILSTVEDAGGSPTTTLRQKLLMGKILSSGKFGVYDPTTTLGLQVPVGVLENATDMIAGGAGDKVASILEGGMWTESEIIGIDAHARALLELRGFEFRDATTNGIKPPQVGSLVPSGGVWRVAGNTTLTAAMNNQLIIATAAADLTLPAIAPGLSFQFLNVADANFGITGAAANLLIVNGNVAATLLRFSTASQKIGASGVVRSVYDGAAWKWHVATTCPNTQTIT